MESIHQTYTVLTQHEFDAPGDPLTVEAENLSTFREAYLYYEQIIPEVGITTTKALYVYWGREDITDAMERHHERVLTNAPEEEQHFFFTLKRNGRLKQRPPITIEELIAS